MSPTATRAPKSPSKTSSSSSPKKKALSKNAAKVAKSRYVKVAKGDRKSNKGWAEGQRDYLFRLMLPSYLKARREGWQAEAQKMLEIQNCYHHHFPYPMKDTDEPTSLVFDIKMTQPPVPPSLSEEETKKMLEYIREYNKRIATRMKRLAQVEGNDPTTGRNSQTEAAFNRILATLDPAKKKARSVVQHWMHVNWTEGKMVRDIVADRWANRMDTSIEPEPPNYRMAVAKELFDVLPEEERETWKESTQEYNIRLKGGEISEVSKEPLDVAATVAAAPGLLFRVARAIEERSSTRIISMMAGPMASFDGDIGFMIISGDKNKAAAPQTFPEFIGREKTKELKELYKAWVLTCFTQEEKQAVIIEDPSTVDWKSHFEHLKSEKSAEESAREARRARIALKAMNYLHQQGRHVPETNVLMYEAGLQLIASGEIEDVPGDGDGSGVQKSVGEQVERTPPSSESNPPSAAKETSPPARREPSVPPPGRDPSVPPPGREPSVPPPGREPSVPPPGREPSVPPPGREPSIPPIPPAGREPSAVPPTTPARREASIPPTPPAGREPSVPPPGREPSVPPIPPAGCEPSAVPPTTPARREASIPPTPPAGREPSAVPPVRRDPSTRKRPASTSPAPSPKRIALSVRKGSLSGSEEMDKQSAGELVERVKGDILEEKKGTLAWTVSCLTEFVEARGGEQLAPLIMSLLTLERRFREKGIKASPRQSIPSGQRPSLVGAWITAGRCDRAAGQNMKIEDAQLRKFVADVCDWWDGMQPAWRIKGDDGYWRRESYTDQWGQMVCPGRNGLLSVVAVLSWWGRKIVVDDSEETQWLMMVEDVKWVVDGLIAAV